ncbi:MAG: PHP domain-containing protein [Mycobacteriales bacterium]|nr:PHP domain-containing protein [Mycobacteriales bacterium]
MRIDLHAHSTASDGTTLPADLVRHAVEVGLDVVALTDHDTTSGWAEAADALPYGLALVRGAELSCIYGGVSLHLLAYLFDPDEPVLAGRLAELRDSRVGRAERMVAQLVAAGVPVSWDQVQALAAGTVGRPHVGQALVEAGVVADLDEAFGLDWIGTRGRYWAGKLELDVLEAIDLVATAGGVTVFAHPAASKRGRTVPDTTIAAMAETGLTGLEVDHVDHDDAERAHLRGLAADLGLVTTGSSDFHGSNKTVALGAHLTSPEQYAEIAALATGSGVVSG